MDSEATRVAEVLSEEFRLALDGYHITVIPAEMDVVLGKITLMVGAQEYERVTIELDRECPTRDEAMLTAMAGFLNSGGDPERLKELAVEVGNLPHIQPNPYKVVGAYGHVDWVSYYQHQDGRIFEVHHGLLAEEITQEQLDQALEEDELDPIERVRLCRGNCECETPEDRSGEAEAPGADRSEEARPLQEG
jgi:hypothetical protein